MTVYDGSCTFNPHNFNVTLHSLSTMVVLNTAAAAAAKSLQSCLTLQPHRLQPIRLPHPWDSPGKNTGMGCHFLLQCIKVKSESEVATPWTAAHQDPPSMGFSRQEYWSWVPSPSPVLNTAAAAAKSLQSCPTLCDPRDGSPSGFPVPGILQARTLERVAISFSNA